MTQWTVPEDAEVHAVLGFLVDDNLKRLFFTELQNPEWVRPLAELGVFAAEPASWVDADGTQRTRTWPEGEYLARVASSLPELVASLLLDHSSSENPWVHRVVVDAALALPAAQASLLIAQIVVAANSPYSRLDPRDIVSLAEAVAPDAPTQARRLLGVVFEPLAGPVEASVLGGRQRVSARFDAYSMTELTPRVAEVLVNLGMAGVRLAAGWLIRGLEIISTTGRAREAHIWRPSISPHAQNMIDEVPDALIELLRQVSRRVARSVALLDVIDFLRGRSLMLLSRIAIDVAAETVAEDGSPAVVEIAYGLLTDEGMLDIDARPEYVRLARTALPLLTDSQMAGWQAMVASERWQGSDDDIRALAEWRLSEGVDVTHDDELRVRRSLLYRLLLPLEGVLPNELEADVATLREEFGEVEHPEFATYVTSHDGSDVVAADLEGLTSDQLYALLEAEDTVDHRIGSVEDMARQLAAFAEKHPGALVDLGTRVLSLSRSFVRATIEGWEKALALGFDPSPDTWDLLAQVAEQPDSGDEPTVNHRSADPEWRWAQRRAAHFVETYLDTRGGDLTADDASATWRVLKPLTNHPDPTPGHEERYGGSNMDALTLSLNTVRPTALRAAIGLLRSVHDQDTSGALVADLWSSLSEHAAVELDPSLAVAAVFGEKLGYLWDLDHTWIEDRRSALLDVLSSTDAQRERSDVVVSVALRIYRTTANFLELVRPTITDMLTAAYRELKHVEGWRGNRTALAAAANHVLTAYVTSLIEEDDQLLAALVSPEVGPAVIAEALGTMGWAFARSRDDAEALASVPEAVLERARGLLDQRVAAIREGVADPSELSEFHWWIRAGLFPPPWWLDVLTVAIANPEFNPHGLIGEALESAAPADPTKALQVLDGLVRNEHDGWARHDLLRHAPSIIVAALDSGDASTVASARDLLDRIGRDGQLTVLAEVDRLRGAGS